MMCSAITFRPRIKQHERTSAEYSDIRGCTKVRVMFYENSSLFPRGLSGPLGRTSAAFPSLRLSFHKIAVARDSVVKKPQEEYTGNIMSLAELTVGAELQNNQVQLHKVTRAVPLDHYPHLKNCRVRVSVICQRIMV
jgi:hypothetical protein